MKFLFSFFRHSSYSAEIELQPIIQNKKPIRKLNAVQKRANDFLLNGANEASFLQQYFKTADLGLGVAETLSARLCCIDSFDSAENSVHGDKPDFGEGSRVNSRSSFASQASGAC